MKLRFGLIALAMLTTSAQAKDFLVNDKDQADILFLCETAARNPNITIEITGNISMFCVAWKGRMQAANLPPPDPKAAPPKK